MTDKPMALSEAKVGVWQLYSRMFEISECNRGILAVPVEQCLLLPL
jgi:hypothetical protein